MNRDIMFLDLARHMGWAEGEPGGRPRFGHVELAPAGSAHHVLMGAGVKWAATRFQAFQPRILYIEAPIDPRHMGDKTNEKTFRDLIGLVSVVEGVAERCGINHIREARRSSITSFMFPDGKPKGNIKHAVISRMRDLGHDVWDDNAADAICGWFYACAQIAPQTAIASTPLFGRGGL